MHPSIHAAKFPDKPAVVMAHSGETITFGTLEARSNQVAHVFRNLGLRAGDCIAVLLDNHPRLYEVVWAAHRAGLYFVCVSTRLSIAEVHYILRDCGAKTVISARTAGDAAPVLPSVHPGPAYWSIGEVMPGYRSLEAAAAGMPSAPIPDQRPGVDMLYSSGTTGRPKGIRPSLPEGTDLTEHSNISRLGQKLYGFDERTVYLSPAPLYHAAPLRWSMAVQKLGGTVIVMQKFDAEEVLALIERHRVTHAQFVPTHFVRMLRLPERARSAYDLSSLKVAIHAAAPCPVHIKQAMLDWLGPVIFEYYGATEGNGVTAIGPDEWRVHPGSVGRAVFGEVKICDEAGEPLPQGETGLVFFANGRTFDYHNDPDKTAASRNRHGWSTVGDIGHLDADGYLYLTDRKSFVIISGGVNIYPQEIENALLEHAAVADAAVIGVPDEEMGETVVAVIQPTAGAAPGTALADELTRFLRSRLSSIKIPRRFDFRAQLPREPSGKLMKRLLRDEYAALAARTVR